MNRERFDLEWEDGYALTRAAGEPEAFRALTHDGMHLGPHATLRKVIDEEERRGIDPMVQAIAEAASVGVGAGVTLGAQRVRGWWLARRERRHADPAPKAGSVRALRLVKPEDQSDAA